jgi:hypothetical protein
MGGAFSSSATAAAMKLLRDISAVCDRIAERVFDQLHAADVAAFARAMPLRYEQPGRAVVARRNQIRRRRRKRSPYGRARSQGRIDAMPCNIA